MSKRSTTAAGLRPDHGRTDAELVECFRAGDEDAFGILHGRYWAPVLRHVRRTLPHAFREDAEDVTQDAFVRAYRALRVDAREIHFRPWLYRIAHNHSLDQPRRRAHRRVELRDDVATAPDPVPDIEAREQVHLIVGDIHRLPGMQGAAVVLREFSGLPYEAIAAELQVTVPAVKSLLVRARRTLRGASAGRAIPASPLPLLVGDPHS
jgi:RNA polymerase sigma factor (sigma-70 family)